MIRKIGIFLLFLILTFLIIIAVNQINWVSHATIKSENEQIEAIKNNSDSIICILKANKRKYKVGEMPDIEVEIINKTDSTILMVGSLDGSDLGVRYPISQFSVKHQFFGDVGFSTLYCLTLNRLRELDFKRIESGFSFNPYETVDDYGFFTPQNLRGYNFLIPGIYTLTYYYSTKGNEDLYMSHEKYENAILDSLWGEIPKIELKSNTIAIEYNL